MQVIHLYFSLIKFSFWQRVTLMPLSVSITFPLKHAPHFCFYISWAQSVFSRQATVLIKVRAFVRLHLFPLEIILFCSWLVFGSFRALIPGVSRCSLCLRCRRIWFDKTSAETFAVLVYLHWLARHFKDDVDETGYGGRERALVCDLVPSVVLPGDVCVW